MSQILDLNFFISVVNNDEINPIFVRANLWLINKHIDKFNDDVVYNFNLLESLWFKEFKALLIFDHSDKIYNTIKFDNAEDMTVFLIRWG